MNHPKTTSFALCTIIGALCLLLVLARIGPKKTNEADGAEPSAIVFNQNTNGIGEEYGFPMKNDRDDESTVSPPASTVYPDSIWGQGFRDDNPKAFDEILGGFESRGALASMSLTVLDETGNPVPNASVRMSFSSPDGLDNAEVRTGATDSDGRFSAEANSIWSVAWVVEKNGYYAFRSNIVLRPYASVQGWKARRWFQKPFPVFALLREKQTPHEMAFRSIRVSLPPPGETMGFDLMEGKPTPPYGSGSTRDFEITETRSPHKRNPHSTEDWFSTLRLVFPNDGDGVVVFHRDDCSELKAPRFAPDDGYRSNLESTIRFKNGKFTEEEMIRSDEYLVFRIRSKTRSMDSNESAVFGKMCGDWHVNGNRRYISFRTWTNEETGARNLEDTSGHW